MNGILSADGFSILSRYMAAMTAAIGPTAASLPNNGSDADIETSHLGMAGTRIPGHTRIVDFGLRTSGHACCREYSEMKSQVNCC
jgi:hypothetical protein